MPVRPRGEEETKARVMAGESLENFVKTEGAQAFFRIIGGSIDAYIESLISEHLPVEQLWERRGIVLGMRRTLDEMQKCLRALAEDRKKQEEGKPKTGEQLDQRLRAGFGTEPTPGGLT